MLAEQIINWRRHLHTIPEQSFFEKETSLYIEKVLKELGVDTEMNVAGTGVIQFIPADDDNMPTVAVRADMDALPIVEKTGLPYASKNEGFMHACGHDAHMAMALRIAGIWKEVRTLRKPAPNFSASRRKAIGRAIKIIESGILDKYKPRAIFAFHVNPLLPCGQVGVKKGVLTAAADRFVLKVIGKGGHGASPHCCIDPIVIASNIVQGWQQIVSRVSDPLGPLVITAGSIHGGSEFNIIPEEVEIKGTVRTLSREMRSKIPSLLEEVTRGYTAPFGASYKFEYFKGYPPLINDPDMTGILAKAAADIFGAKNVIWLDKPTMGGEDMAYFLETIPGCYAYLGVGPEKGEPVPWHSSFFTLDEKALHLGTAALAWSCYLKLEKGSSKPG